MGRDENVAIFQDTLYRCEKTYPNEVENSCKHQKVIKEGEDIGVGKLSREKYDKDATVKVTTRRTLEAAKDYKDKKTCALNFASAVNPGGGVVNGATAQEESICRISTAYPCLNTKSNWKEFYGPHRLLNDRLYNDDVLYTPDIVVFKTDTNNPVLLPQSEVYKVNMITCAAPNLNSRNMRNDSKLVRKITDKELLEIHIKRLRRILDVALKNGNECVILGAFGCGAFMNNPEVVARAARTVIVEYRHAFECIEFAVYCSPKDTRNYDVFKRVMRGL